MTAKLTLIGQPQGLLILDGVATFRTIAGPASSAVPKGLPLFKAITYLQSSAAITCQALPVRQRTVHA